jgi:F-type H+-transporting ATPase subunit c
MAKRTWMFLTLAAGMLLATPFVAMAQEGAVAAAPGSGLRAGLIALGSGLGIGIAALGCGLGQGKLAASAMESIGRNPNSANTLFGPMIIGLAFVESLSLYALLVAFLLQLKV